MGDGPRDGGLPVLDPQLKDLREKLRRARTAFVQEAREDVEDPVRRNASPGITVKHAMQIGGFHLKDAG
jgi:hypothetical protein